MIFSLLLINFAYASSGHYCPTCEKIVYEFKLLKVKNLGAIREWGCKVCGTHIFDTGYGTSNKYKEPMSDILSDDEILQNFKDLRDQIADMSTFDNDDKLDENSIFNTDNMLKKVFDGCIDALNTWSNSSLYYYFVGIGILIFTINFVLGIYQNNLNHERKSVEQIVRLMFQCVISLIIILNINNLLKFFLIFFRWILENVISFKNSGANNFNITDVNDISVADELTIHLVRESDLDSEGVLEKVFSGIGASFLRLKLFVPWLLCVVSKVGILLGIFKNAFEIIQYSFLFPLAAGDCFDNIKQSRFMRYSKKIMSCLLQMSIISLTAFSSKLLLNGFVNEIFTELSITKDQSANKIFTTFFVLCAIQISRTVVINTSSSIIASKALGE